MIETTFSSDDVDRLRELIDELRGEANGALTCNFPGDAKTYNAAADAITRLLREREFLHSLLKERTDLLIRARAALGQILTTRRHMGLYDGTKFEFLDEPKTIRGPFCVDCRNFIADGELCRQSVTADFVHGTLKYRKAQDCRYGDSAIGLDCTHEGLWFLPKQKSNPP